MKAKHYSLVFSLVLITLCLVSSLWAYMLQQNEAMPTVRFASAKVNANNYLISVPEKKLKSIAEDIYLYSDIDEDKYSQTDLTVLGYAPVKQDINRNQSINKASKPDYSISMAIVFNQNKYCVIDEKFYREGDQLSKDVFVKVIQKKRVLIDEYGKEQWHNVTNGQLDNKGINNESFALSAR